MNVEDIPANEVVLMTPLLHRAFRAGGCNPICHCCMKSLDIGKQFQLATVKTQSTRSSNSGINIYVDSLDETREVMLCSTCTIEKFDKMTAKKKKEYEVFRAKGGGCFRVNGKIVH